MWYLKLKFNLLPQHRPPPDGYVDWLANLKDRIPVEATEESGT